MLFIDYLALAMFLLQACECFVPAKLIRSVIDKADDKLRLDFGEVSESIVHEDIVKRGILSSVAKYMFENPTNISKINLTKLTTGEYYTARNLYFDYYGKNYCTIDVDILIKTVFQPAVAFVDFDSATKDLPDAHFDGNSIVFCRCDSQLAFFLKNQT
jgi:hypothetical protein